MNQNSSRFLSATTQKLAPSLSISLTVTTSRFVNRGIIIFPMSMTRQETQLKNFTLFAESGDGVKSLSILFGVKVVPEESSARYSFAREENPEERSSTTS